LPHCLRTCINVCAMKAVNPDPKGAENGPHQYTYKPNLHPEQNTVIAPEGCKSRVGGTPSSGSASGQPKETQGERGAGQGPETLVRTDTGTVMRISSKELTFLAPRLRNYLRSTEPNWREIVDAADYRRGELGVSNPFGARPASPWGASKRRSPLQSSP
jgi:replication initiation protein RepC